MFELTTGAVAQTMTSTEIASLTGKSKGNIHRDIKEQLLLGLYGMEDSNLNLLDIKGISVILANNGFWSEVHLDRYHTDILVSGYEVKYRAAIVKRWYELEEAARKGISNTRMLANLAVQMADAVLSQSGWYSILGFAKLHGLPVTTAQAFTYSRGVNRLCLRDSITRQETKDPRFGTVFIYPEDHITEYFVSKGLLEL